MPIVCFWRTWRRLLGLLQSNEIPHPQTSGCVLSSQRHHAPGKTLGKDHERAAWTNKSWTRCVAAWQPWGVPPEAPDKVPEGSLVHQGEWLPSKFSRWFPKQMSSISKQVQSIFKRRANIKQSPSKCKQSYKEKKIMKSRDIQIVRESSKSSSSEQ